MGSFGVMAGVIWALLSIRNGEKMFEKRFPKYFVFLEETIFGDGLATKVRDRFFFSENGVENKDLENKVAVKLKQTISIQN